MKNIFLVFVAIAIILTVNLVYAGDILPDLPLQIYSYVGDGLSQDTVYIFNPNDKPIDLYDYELAITINGEISEGDQFYFDHNDFASKNIQPNSYTFITVYDFDSEGYTRPYTLTFYDNLHDKSLGHMVEFDTLAKTSPFDFTPVYLPMITK